MSKFKNKLRDNFTWIFLCVVVYSILYIFSPANNSAAGIDYVPAIVEVLPGEIR